MGMWSEVTQGQGDAQVGAGLPEPAHRHNHLAARPQWSLSDGQSGLLNLMLWVRGTLSQIPQSALGLGPLGSVHCL